MADGRSVTIATTNGVIGTADAEVRATLARMSSLAEVPVSRNASRKEGDAPQGADGS
jgi:hypothetical protein